jgi:DNA-directed RNA polymerase delta subunit
MSNDATNGYVDYDAVLADLQSKRDQIDAAIAAINLIRGGVASATSPSAAMSQRGIPANAFFTMGIGEAARKYLEMVKGKQTVGQITKALEQGGMPPLKVNTVYAALRRREAINKDIIRLGEEWGLREWFSNVSIPKQRLAKPPKPRAATKERATAKVKEPTASTKGQAGATKDSEGSAAPQPITMVDAVEKILTEARVPLYAGDLVEELKERYGKTSTNIKSLRASLPKDSKKRFVNVGNNTWGLATWANTEHGEKRLNPNEVQIPL